MVGAFEKARILTMLSEPVLKTTLTGGYLIPAGRSAVSPFRPRPALLDQAEPELAFQGSAPGWRAISR
jgi:hypothetical protein